MRVVDNGLNEKIYKQLRDSVNFIPYNKDDVEYALKNTLYSVVIYDNDEPVGCGRIVGDNRVSFFIKDVVVYPPYQGKGVGKLVMNSLLKYIKEHACYNAYIGLMSTPKREEFYERFGFIKRPNENYGAGMVMYYKGENNK